MSEDDPAPFVLDFDGLQVPLLVRVRQWLATELVGVAEDHLHAVMLVCTELVTNVFEHAVGPCRIRLERSRVPCWVRVEVQDGSLAMPVVGRSGKGVYGGRGLLLVEKMSERWGVDPTDSGKTVWAQVSCDDPARGITRCPPS
jgi:two-component sensor histidine kinase